MLVGLSALSFSCLSKQGTYRIASWRGIEVAVKTLADDVVMDEEKV